MVTIPSIRVRFEGDKEVAEGYKNLGRSIQTQAGIMASRSSHNIEKWIKHLISSWNVTDTGDLINSIRTIQIKSYIWEVGDFEYSPNVKPHLIFVEHGFVRHWIHRSMINPWSVRMAGFLATNKNFLEVGPMYERPVVSEGIKHAQIENFPYENKVIQRIIRESFRNCLKGYG